MRCLLILMKKKHPKETKNKLHGKAQPHKEKAEESIINIVTKSYSYVTTPLTHTSELSSRGKHLFCESIKSSMRSGGTVLRTNDVKAEACCALS